MPRARSGRWCARIVEPTCRRAAAHARGSARTGLTRSRSGRPGESSVGRHYIRVGAICVSLRAHTPYIVNSHTFVPPFSPRVWTGRVRERALARIPGIARYAAIVNSRRIIPTRNLRIRETAAAATSSMRDISVEGHSTLRIPGYEVPEFNRPARPASSVRLRA